VPSQRARKREPCVSALCGAPENAPKTEVAADLRPGCRCHPL